MAPADIFRHPPTFSNVGECRRMSASACKVMISGQVLFISQEEGYVGEHRPRRRIVGGCSGKRMLWPFFSAAVLAPLPCPPAACPVLRAAGMAATVPEDNLVAPLPAGDTLTGTCKTCQRRVEVRGRAGPLSFERRACLLPHDQRCAATALVHRTVKKEIASKEDTTENPSRPRRVWLQQGCTAAALARLRHIVKTVEERFLARRKPSSPQARRRGRLCCAFLFSWLLMIQACAAHR